MKPAAGAGVALVAIAGAMVLGHARAQREIRLAAYLFELRLWEIRQNAAVHRYLSGQSDEHGMTPPPTFRG